VNIKPLLLKKTAYISVVGYAFHVHYPGYRQQLPMHSSAVEHSGQMPVCKDLCLQELSTSLTANWLAEERNWKNHFPASVHACEQHNQIQQQGDLCLHSDQVH